MPAKNMTKGKKEETRNKYFLIQSNFYTLVIPPSSSGKLSYFPPSAKMFASCHGPVKCHVPNED